jgi:hypothetical protein
MKEHEQATDAQDKRCLGKTLFSRQVGGELGLCVICGAVSVRCDWTGSWELGVGMQMQMQRGTGLGKPEYVSAVNCGFE